MWYSQLSLVSRHKSSDGGISDFQIFDQSLIKENYHNSRISDDIDIKQNKEKETKQRQKNLTMASGQ